MNIDEKPNAARMYDYYLGGHHNTAVDAKAAEATLKLLPLIRYSARASRQTLQRFTVYMVTELGIDQILDLGSGLPTMGNVHEIALQFSPKCKVVYVDHDPTVVQYSQRLLDSQGVTNQVATVSGDIRQIEDIFNHPTVKQYIDFSRPVGVLASAVFHFLEDADVQNIVNYAYNNVAPGSCFALTHGVIDGFDPDRDKQITDIYSRSTTPLHMRTVDEVKVLLNQFHVIEPGFVDAPHWRPDPDQPPIGGVYNYFGMCSGLGVK